MPPTPIPRVKEPPTPEQVRRALTVMATAIVVGLVADLGLRGTLVSLGSALVITAVAGGVLVLAEDRPAERWAFAGLAVLAAGGLAWRTSPWVVPVDWAMALGFLGLASSTSAEHPVVGSSLSRILWRSAAPPTAAPFVGVAELGTAADTVRRRPKDRAPDPDAAAWRRHLPAVGRGLLIAVPLLLVLGALLASADGVFASFVDIPTPDLGHPFVHLFLTGLGAATVAGLARWSREPVEPSAAPGRPLGPVETLVILVGLAGLYGLFAISQLVASTAGKGHIEETTGLTYAEYARSGFFQLLWAAGITIAVLLGLRALSRPGGLAQQLAVRIVSALTCALTLVVVAAALTRLGFYQDAYGLTMLRLACTTFAWILGAAFVLLGARLLQGGGRDWLPAAYLGLALVSLVWWNASNPEARVVRTNIDHALATGKLDVDYLDSMSDDAIPAAIDGIDRLPKDLAATLRNRLCTPPKPPEDPYEFVPAPSHATVDVDGVVRIRPGWVSYNHSRRTSAEALEGCAQ